MYNSTLSKIYLNATDGGSVDLYHDNSKKLATTATGVDVTGTVTADGLTVDGQLAVSAANARIRLFETDTTNLNTQLQNQAGVFNIQTLRDDASLATSLVSIDHSTGNVLVGKTSTAVNTQGIQLGADGRFYATSDGAESAVFNRKTSDGVIASFRKDNTTVGSIGVSSSRIYIAPPTGYGIKVAGNDVRLVTTGGANSDNTLDLGVSFARFKDLYLSGGAYLGGTGSANKLDSYEEGSWTPAFVVASGSATYTSQIGNYVKVGRMVTATFVIVVNISSSLVSASIGGLPFAGSDTNYSAASFSSYEAGAFSGYSNLLGLMANTTTSFQLRGTTSATSAPTVLTVSITNGTTVAGSITYYTS